MMVLMSRSSRRDLTGPKGSSALSSLEEKEKLKTVGRHLILFHSYQPYSHNPAFVEIPQHVLVSAQLQRVLVLGQYLTASFDLFTVDGGSGLRAGVIHRELGSGMDVRLSLSVRSCDPVDAGNVRHRQPTPVTPRSPDAFLRSMDAG